MKRITGATKYYNFSELKGGEVLVDGHYSGEVEGKYGKQHEFKDLDGTIVVIGGGHLNWLVEKHLNEGSRCRVLFDKMDTLAGGKYSGKEVKKFILEVEDEEEEKPVAKTKPAEPVSEDPAPWDGGGDEVVTGGDEDESEDDMFGV